MPVPVCAVATISRPAIAGATSASAQGLDAGWGVVTSNDGRNVYSVSYADDTIVTFDRDPATGRPTPAGGSDLDRSPGANDRNGAAVIGSPCTAASRGRRDGRQRTRNTSRPRVRRPPVVVCDGDS